jgi:hypothetical protein
MFPIPPLSMCVKFVIYPAIYIVEKTVETIGGAINNATEYVTTTAEERDKKRRENEYRIECYRSGKMIENWYTDWFYGACFAALFGMMTFGIVFIEEGGGWTHLIGSFVLFAIAISCVFFGRKSLMVARRCKIYLPIILSRDEIMLKEIAEMCNFHTHIVFWDLQRMISKGVLEGYYLDLKRNLLLKAKPPA